MSYLNFVHVSFGYESSIEMLVKDLSLQFTAGWCGIIGPNGSGKTTLLRLAAGELSPTSGAIFRSDSVVHCPQRTDDPPAMFAELLLSHGERKRAQIATALWRRPELLTIDEPTNHIDADAHSLLVEVLRGYRGVGLLVSHDRDLLDGLCERSLFMTPPTAVLRPGGYSQVVVLAEADQARLRTERELAGRELQRLRTEASSRQHAARQADRKRSLKGTAHRDSDARENEPRSRQR